MIPSVWPLQVQQHIQATYGSPTTVERLGGMSGSQVYRVRCADKSIVVKGMDRASEHHFYQTAAPALNDHGVATPALEWSGYEGRTYWLILEDIPQLLPHERRNADLELLTVLGRLHASGVTLPRGLPGMYQPRWTREMTEGALSWLPRTDSALLKPILRGMREEHQYLFTPHCPISGDPNPTNWGLRDDGTLVLYDWERFCHGTPALDLAITIPELGDSAAYQRVASRYLESGALTGEILAGTTKQLAHDIGLAKVWSIVEFLSQSALGTLHHDRVISWLIQRFPNWVRSIS